MPMKLVSKLQNKAPLTPSREQLKKCSGEVYEPTGRRGKYPSY